MSKKNLKPVAAAIGAAFAGSMMLSGTVNAAGNPFAVNELSSGYMQLADGHGGGDKAKKMEGKCGAGKCGDDKAKKMGEGKCGAGKCGDDKAKKMGEGKCGAGKCGDDKAKKMGEAKDEAKKDGDTK